MTEAQTAAVGLRGGREPLEQRNKTKYQCEGAGGMFGEFGGIAFAFVFVSFKRQMLRLFPRLLTFLKMPTTADRRCSREMQNQRDVTSAHSAVTKCATIQEIRSL